MIVDKRASGVDRLLRPGIIGDEKEWIEKIQTKGSQAKRTHKEIEVLTETKDTAEKEEEEKTVGQKKQEIHLAVSHQGPERPSVLENDTDPDRRRFKNQTTAIAPVLISKREAAVYEKVGHLMIAAGNVTRLRIMAFCSAPRRFREIVKSLKMNPASLKFHQELLQSEGLVGKKGKGHATRYQTTRLGEEMLAAVRGPLRELVNE